MNKLSLVVLVTLTVPGMLAAKEPIKALSADKILILKIDSQDERAVMKTPDGKMQILKVGDAIGDNAKVTEIAKDRVVVEEKTSKGIEKVIIRLVNGTQHVERLSRVPETQPHAYSAGTGSREKSLVTGTSGTVKIEKPAPAKKKTGQKKKKKEKKEKTN